MKTATTTTTTTTNMIEINNYAKKREHALNCTWSDLLTEVQSNWEKGVSKEPGILIVPINPALVKGELVTLKGGETLVASFEPRKGVQEDPRKNIRGHHSLTPDPVVAADVILYTHEKLKQDASTEAEWEIVTFRALSDPNQPQALDGLLYNLFGGSGGTLVAENKTAEEKLEMIRASWDEWKDKVIIAPALAPATGKASASAVTKLMEATGMMDMLKPMLSMLPEQVKLKTWELIMEAHEIYTPLEIAEITAFYEGETGRAMAAKAPLLLERLVAIPGVIKNTCDPSM